MERGLHLATPISSLVATKLDLVTTHKRAPGIQWYHVMTQLEVLHYRSRASPPCSHTQVMHEYIYGSIATLVNTL